MSSIVESALLDKGALSVSPLAGTSPDHVYWLQKTAEERLSALQYLRVLNYGEVATSARLERTITVTPLRAS